MDSKKRDQRIEKMEKTLPHRVLEYPDKDPSVNEMLVKYTIWKDIKVFSTFFNQLEKKKNVLEDMENGKVQIARTPVHDHKMNVYLSIALEAERVFKQTYVNTDEIRK